MLPGSSEDWPECPGAAQATSHQSPPRDGAGGDEEEAAEGFWRRHQKHVFVLSEAGKPVYSAYGSGGTFQHHGRHGGPGVLPRG